MKKGALIVAGGILGILAILLLGVLISENRRAINPRIIFSTLALQAAIAGFSLSTSVGQAVLGVLTRGAQSIISYADDGIIFLFGDLGDPTKMFVVAFRVLPVIIFVSSLISILYYLRIMPLFIRGIGYILRALTGISRLEATSASANIFVGMVESPMTIRPYLPSLTRSQLLNPLHPLLAAP